jgi:hypothetical protein
MVEDAAVSVIGERLKESIFVIIVIFVGGTTSGDPSEDDKDVIEELLEGIRGPEQDRQRGTLLSMVAKETAMSGRGMIACILCM